jgi:bacillithiol synthase
MHASCSNVSYSSTNFFSKIVNDYTQFNDSLKPFVVDFPSKVAFEKKIEERKKLSCNRNKLVEVITQQYQNISLTSIQNNNLDLLLQENCFTVTTAHQPNIFTGPLYFIYKIVHAIKLSEELKYLFPENNFVPIYYMGSEDADLDELGNFTIDGYKRTWQTNQTGSVGRMLVDDAFLKLIHDFSHQLNVLPFGKELSELMATSYTKATPIQQATLKLVNKLFANYGLLIIIPDNALLKTTFNEIVTKELVEQFSHKAVEATNIELSKHYNIQAAGRDINLFYLIDDKRERIEKEENFYVVKALEKTFTQKQILHELEVHPERFSANVILRPVFQETILPNIAFIGGGGELAYWMQLKKVFDAVNTSFPILVLRNSFLLIEDRHQQKIQKIGFNDIELFEDDAILLKKMVTIQSKNNWHIEQEIEQLKLVFNSLNNKANAIDTTLIDHVQSVLVTTQKKLKGIEAKLYRAEKRKFTTQHEQIKNIKSSLFPNNNLQERVENFSSFYAKYGSAFIENLYQHSSGFKQEFGILRIAEA